MSESVPTVAGVMTACPVTIEGTQTVGDAARLMRERGIRHLPVVVDGKLAGLVTDRDLALVHSLIDVDPERIAVANAMEREPLCLAPDTPLDEVLDEMVSRKLGAVVVVEGEAIAGIFTTIDALGALRRTLRGEARGHP